MKNAIRRARYRGDRAAARQLRQQQRSLPSGDPRDPGYRRLRYARYADDHLLGFTGPKAEAEEIKARLAAFLRDDLKLELTQEKTLITHARTRRGEIPRLRDHRSARRSTAVQSTVPIATPRAADVIKAKCAPYLHSANPSAGPRW